MLFFGFCGVAIEGSHHGGQITMFSFTTGSFTYLLHREVWGSEEGCSNYFPLTTPEI